MLSGFLYTNTSREGSFPFYSCHQIQKTQSTYLNQTYGLYVALFNALSSKFSMKIYSNDGRHGGIHTCSGCSLVELVISREVHSSKVMFYKRDEI